ncbi:MAG: DUF134 domain-containing protein [Firmicutes bacterium]|nr:DUF134 domain-containing protein [Bacillota bacterium]
MARPPKIRRVEFLPETTVFKPAGVPVRDLQEQVLAVEELEALRLKDLEGLEQEECAKRMHISRPTFQRILTSAREKVARALVEGNMIRVEGGHYRVAMRQFQCEACRGHFEVPYGAGRGRDINCPHCGGRAHRAGRGHRHGRQ